jgi:PhoD-like phosphatase
MWLKCSIVVFHARTLAMAAFTFTTLPRRFQISELFVSTLVVMCTNMDPFQCRRQKFSSTVRKSHNLATWKQIDSHDCCLCQASCHSDEGLRNLRRRAPLITIWDDHETENNLSGQGSNSKTGAENHQPFCAVNPSSFGYVKRAANVQVKGAYSCKFCQTF